MTRSAKLITVFMLSLNLVAITPSGACTRFTYTGLDNLVLVGRSMDWVDNLQTELWAFPAGLKRKGNGDDKNGVEWVAKYGSVITSSYKLAATDGINTAGLDANLLYLSGSNYGTPQVGKKNLSVFNWVQYMLDNYATVSAAVKDFGSGRLNLIVPAEVHGHTMDLHLALSDASGDNAVFEYIDGKLIIHHGKQYTVMTNEPAYDQQLALNAYWQNMDGKFLPGTENPADRFVRTSFYLNEAPKTANSQQALASVFSIIRNASVPFGQQNDIKRPNVSVTLWRSVADLKNKVYYFEETYKPNIFWVDLHKLNLSTSAAVKKLPLANGQIYAGETSSSFVVAQPFVSPQVYARQ